MRDVATHRPRVGFNAYRIEAHALERARIRPMLGGVAPFETRLVDIEAVRVFHDELARAQNACAGARLIAPLRLEVIDDLWHLLVALDLLHRVQVHELLMRVAHHELAAVVVFRAEGDRLQHLPPAGLLPCLRGREDGHLHLLGPDAVLLFADDPLDLLSDAEAEGQPGVKTGGERPRDRGAQHEAMPGGLSFRGRFAQGAAKELGLLHCFAPRVIFGRGRIAGAR